MAGFLDSPYDLANEISGRTRSDLAVVLDTLVRKLDGLRDDLALLRQEVKQMSDANTTLDQAVADLSAASTAKIAEDQPLAADAKIGQNTAADVAKVESIVGDLNAETAAEQLITNATPAPAPVATAVPVPVASVDTPAGRINPIPTAAVVNS